MKMFRLGLVFPLLAVATAQLSPIDVREATISSLHASLFSGVTTCREIVTAFVARIQRFDPDINAIVSI